MNRSSPCVEQRLQADVYLMALFTPVEELPDPGINIIKILSLTGILQFNGRNFTFCRALI